MFETTTTQDAFITDGKCIIIRVSEIVKIERNTAQINKAYNDGKWVDIYLRNQKLSVCFPGTIPEVLALITDKDSK